MNVKPIRDDAEFDEAVRRASHYFDAKPVPGSPEGDTYEMLLMVIEAYQDERWPVEAPDAIEAIKFRMEQGGLTPTDLVPMIGPIDVVAEVLAGKRELTLPIIRRLHKDLGISAESLISKVEKSIETQSQLAC